MIKQLASNRLMVGMHIHDLGASWMNHPFLSNSFVIKDARTIGKILEAGIKQVFIDTEKGIDLPEDARPLELVAQPAREKKRQIIFDQPGVAKRTSYEQEVYQARQILRETQLQVRSFMELARTGQPINVDQVESLVDKIIGSISRNKDALIHLSRIKQRDQYTYQHSIAVCVLMTAFAKAMSLDENTVRDIGTGALLHDLGKMRVPTGVLNKPSKLTAEEYKLMQDHVELGAEVLADTPGVSDAAVNIAMQHHERIDGSGYPFGLMADEISQEGQMAAIVDVFDALTSDRVYKKAWEPTYTLGRLLEWSGERFDKSMVHQFVRCVGIYPVGTLVKLDSGMVGVVIDQHEKNLLTPTVRVVYDEANKRYIKPNDLDLGKHKGETQILGAVAPTDIGVDPLAFV